MTTDRDLGDEDDLESSPRRHWSRFTLGRTMIYRPLRWTHERLAPLPGHDPGDEDDLEWWSPLSELSARRIANELL